MDPTTLGALGGFLGPLGSGIASAFGASAAASTNADEQEKTNQEMMGFNAQQAQLNRDFQTEMSNTAYQRAMGDMRAAGLNPMLAYQQGGASTPSGSTASANLTAPAPGVNIAAPIGKGLETGISSAMEVAKTMKDLDVKDSVIAMNNAAAQVKREQIPGTISSASEAKSSAQISGLQAQLAQMQQPAKALQADTAQKQAWLDNKTAYLDKILEKIRQFVPFTSSAVQQTKLGPAYSTSYDTHNYYSGGQ